MREQILAAYDKGFGAEAIARMLKIDMVQVCAALGIDNVASSDTARRGTNVADSDKEIDNATLRNMARQTLAALIDDMQHNPSAFKPNEIIAAIREALDRTEGKAAQTLNVESKATVTHEHIMSIAPADAYRMLLDGGTIVDLAASQQALPHHPSPNLNGGG